MGTSGYFDVDANTNALLNSYLIDGPMGALPGGRKKPYAPNVCSVRSLFDPDLGMLESVILIDGGPQQKASPPVKIAQVNELYKLLLSLAPNEKEIWTSAFVKFIRTPEVYQVPGDIVTAYKRGIAGIRVTWDTSAPKQGVLAAGHVIGAQKNAKVGKASGTIPFSIDFLNSGTIPQADVAVIELADVVKCEFNSTAVATFNHTVDFIVKGKAKRTQIISPAGEGIFMPTRSGTVGHVYLAWPSVTEGGDSGALAINSRGEAIGHLVGGSGQDFDFIQAIDYQLQAIKLPGVSL
jgi:hypothetical protein